MYLFDISIHKFVYISAYCNIGRNTQKIFSGVSNQKKMRAICTRILALFTPGVQRLSVTV